MSFLNLDFVRSPRVSKGSICAKVRLAADERDFVVAVVPFLMVGLLTGNPRHGHFL
jgi:hypothetical protein